MLLRFRASLTFSSVFSIEWHAETLSMRYLMIPCLLGTLLASGAVAAACGGATCGAVAATPPPACADGGTLDTATGLCRCADRPECSRPDCRCRECGEHGVVRGAQGDQCACDAGWAEDATTGQCSVFFPATAPAASSSTTGLSAITQTRDEAFVALDNAMRVLCVANMGAWLWLVRYLIPT